MKLGIVLTHDHRLLSVAAALDVFETVNRFYEEEGLPAFFDIHMLYPKQYDHIVYQQYPMTQLEEQATYDVLLIPSFKSQELSKSIAENSIWIPWLQNQYKKGAAIASFCTGAFLLAATGLLDDKPATTHINAENAFALAFPKIKLQADAVVTEEQGIYTSGGATNSFHLIMRLIENYCNRKIAIRAAKMFSIDLDRTQQTYFGTFSPTENHGDELVKQVQDEIKKKFKEASTIEELITEVPASRRNLVRRFKQATGVTPIEYLQKTRIEAAKQLLAHSRQSVLDVMLESGYNDLKTFRLLFKKNVGMTPTAYRDKFNGQPETHFHSTLYEAKV